MQRLATPWMFLGPSGSGKLTTARKWIEEANGVKLTYPLEVRAFKVGDAYQPNVLISPYHFEIDIPNLSMQDKQIIGDLLGMFLSSGDVLSSLRSSSRKLVILRRAHSLSLPAAIRLRAVLQQYVLPTDASGMIWITAREITGPLSLFDDIFVPVRIPRMPMDVWKSRVAPVFQTEEAWQKLEGRPERATMLAKFYDSDSQLCLKIPASAAAANEEKNPDIVWPRRIQDYYDEMIREMIRGAKTVTNTNVDCIEWIRGRVYDALSFCQTGPEIIDSCAAAICRQVDLLETQLFWEIMSVLFSSEPHTSYRTPLSLEWAMLRMFDVIFKYYHGKEQNGGIVGATPKECTAVCQEASSTGSSNSKTTTKRRGTVATKASA